MLAAFAPGAEAQRTREADPARRSEERPAQSRRAQDVRPQEPRRESADQARARRAEAAQDAQRQSRRAEAARDDAQALRRREIRQERRLRAALDQDDDRAVLRGMFTEVGVHRDRMARIHRLERILSARGDEDGLRRVRELESVEQRRFEGLISSARRRVSAEDLRRFDDEVGPNAGVRARDAEEGGR